MLNYKTWKRMTGKYPVDAGTHESLPLDYVLKNFQTGYDHPPFAVLPVIRNFNKRSAIYFEINLNALREFGEPTGGSFLALEFTAWDSDGHGPNPISADHLASGRATSDGIRHVYLGSEGYIFYPSETDITWVLDTLSSIYPCTYCDEFTEEKRVEWFNTWIDYEWHPNRKVFLERIQEVGRQS